MSGRGCADALFAIKMPYKPEEGNINKKRPGQFSLVWVKAFDTTDHQLLFKILEIWSTGQTTSSGKR
eukprot:scaffold38615_cov63-Attheya_sp.AAC.1